MMQIPDAAVQEELDTRLKAAGMYTVEEVMAGTPVDKWRVYSGMNNLQFFGEWLERKAREYKVMAAGYDLGDKDKSDELYEWVLAHSGAFHDVLVNFRAATLTNESTKPVDVAAVQDSPPSGEWPPLKKALWDVLMEEKLNDGHYIKAFEFIEKLHSAAIRALSAEPAQGEQWRDTRHGALCDRIVVKIRSGEPITDQDASDLLDTIAAIRFQCRADPTPEAEA